MPPQRHATAVRRDFEAVLVGAAPPESPPLRDALVALGAREVHSVAGLREVAGVARGGTGDLLVAAAGSAASRGALAWLVTSPGGTVALTGTGGEEGAYPVRTRRGRVVSAGSPRHTVGRPTGTSLGLLRIAGADRAAAAAAAERAAALGPASRDEPAPSTDGAPPPPAGARPPDPVALLLVALVRARVGVTAVPLRGFGWARGTAALASADDERAWLEAAVKANDGLFTTHLVSPWSKHVARRLARRGVAPDTVTFASLAVGAASAASFAARRDVAGAVLLQAAFALDCVDGQLARYARTFTRRGAWLDSVGDRAKEYLVYAGLAAGGGAWRRAGAALALQTVRHRIELGFGAAESAHLAAAPQPPLEQPGDGVAGAGAPPDPLGDAAGGGALGAFGGLVWARKLAPFPIGERFAVISLGAALLGPEGTFAVLLAGGAAAALYTTAGRLARARDGIGFGWLPPAALGAAEYAAVLAAGAAAGADAAAFALLAALAYRHYDEVYALRPAPAWLRRLELAAPVLAAARAVRPGYAALAAALAAGSAAEARAAWRAAA